MKKTFQGEIIARFLNKKAMVEFVESYEQSKKQIGGGAHRPVSKEERNIAYDWKKGATLAELTAKYKKPIGTIRSAIYRVSKETFLKS